MNTRFKLHDSAWLVNLETKQRIQASIIKVCLGEDDAVKYSVRLVEPGWADLEISGLTTTWLMGSDECFGGDGYELKKLDRQVYYDEAEDGTLPDLEMLRIAMERLGFKRDGSIYELGNNVGWFTAWMEHRCTMLKWTGDKDNWKEQLCDGPTANHIIQEIRNVMAANKERTT